MTHYILEGYILVKGECCPRSPECMKAKTFGRKIFVGKNFRKGNLHLGINYLMVGKGLDCKEGAGGREFLGGHEG